MNAAHVQLESGGVVAVPVSGPSQPVRLVRGCRYHIRVAPVVVVDDGIVERYSVPVYIVAGDQASGQDVPQGHPIIPEAPLEIIADVDTVTLVQGTYGEVSPWWTSLLVTVSLCP
jgi:hypothetical protein